jgi:hypothetical protein
MLKKSNKISHHASEHSMLPHKSFTEKKYILYDLCKKDK